MNRCVRQHDLSIKVARRRNWRGQTDPVDSRSAGQVRLCETTVLVDSRSAGQVRLCETTVLVDSRTAKQVQPCESTIPVDSALSAQRTDHVHIACASDQQNSYERGRPSVIADLLDSPFLVLSLIQLRIRPEGLQILLHPLQERPQTTRPGCGDRVTSTDSPSSGRRSYR